MLKPYPAIVICCDGHIQGKLNLIQYALEQGKHVIETSADPNVIHTLIEYFNGIPKFSGSLLIGMGVFPGLSNLMIQHTLDQYPHIKNIGIKVSTSPFAGAGKGMCSLMVDFLKQSHVPFMPSIQAFAFGFPEIKMFEQTDPSIDLKTYYQISPAWLHTFVLILLKTNILNIRLVERFMKKTLFWLRGYALKHLKSPITLDILNMEAFPETSPETLMSLSYTDGIELACLAVLYTIQNSPQTQEGVQYPQNICDFKAALNWIQLKTRHRFEFSNQVQKDD